jgi:filamentous hemagglutinin
LAATLKVVGQQRLLAEQPQKFAELAELFSKGSGTTLRFAGQRDTATIESNLTGTTKVFDTAALTNKQLERQVFDYVISLTGGQAIKPVIKEGVELGGRWTTTLVDGTTINLRSYSSSGVGRWTVDIKGSLHTNAIKPGYQLNSYELKFK